MHVDLIAIFEIFSHDHSYEAEYIGPPGTVSGYHKQLLVSSTAQHNPTTTRDYTKTPSKGPGADG
jgi:hypothetical protein